MVLGLGTSEILLIVVVAIIVVGPKNLNKIKPFFKNLYKMYLRMQQETDITRHQFVDIEKEVKEQLGEVKKQAEKEYIDDIKKASMEVRKEMAREAREISVAAAKEFDKEKTEILQDSKKEAIADKAVASRKTKDAK